MTVKPQCCVPVVLLLTLVTMTLLSITAEGASKTSRISSSSSPFTDKKEYQRHLYQISVTAIPLSANGMVKSSKSMEEPKKNPLIYGTENTSYPVEWNGTPSVQSLWLSKEEPGIKITKRFQRSISDFVRSPDSAVEFKLSRRRSFADTSLDNHLLGCSTESAQEAEFEGSHHHHKPAESASRPGILESELVSRHLHEVLCDHPPNKYLPSFNAESENHCMDVEGVKTVLYHDTLKMCMDIFYIIYEHMTPFFFGLFFQGGDDTGFLIYSKKEFVQVCSPLHERFEACERNDFATICWDARIAFVHSHDCPNKYQEIFLAYFLLHNDSYCFNQFCNSYGGFVDSDIRGLHFMMMTWEAAPDEDKCNYIKDHLKLVSIGDKELVLSTVNLHWPCCYAQYMVTWYGNPEEHGINGNWDYLPWPCKLGEVTLMVMIGLVAFGGIFGNLFVITVMLLGKHRQRESNMIRTSLAVADFLTAAFVSAPSLYHHVDLLSKTPEYTNLIYPKLDSPNHNTYKTNISLNSFFDNGLLLLRGLIFSTCIIVSLFSLCLLSFERFISTGRALKYQHYFSTGRIRSLIVIFWGMGIVDAVLFAYDGSGHLKVAYLKFEKIPVAFEEVHPENLVLLVLKSSQFFIFYFMGISMIILSALSVRNFNRKQRKVADEWRTLDMRVSGPYKEEDRYIRNSMLIMLLFFLVSVVPKTIDTVFTVSKYSFRLRHLYRYFSWWTVIGASAWNPWIYNIRSHLFRKDVAQIILRRKFEK